MCVPACFVRRLHTERQRYFKCHVLTRLPSRVPEFPCMFVFPHRRELAGRCRTPVLDAEAPVRRLRDSLLWGRNSLSKNGVVVLREHNSKLSELAFLLKPPTSFPPGDSTRSPDPIESLRSFSCSAERVCSIRNCRARRHLRTRLLRLRQHSQRRERRHRFRRIGKWCRSPRNAALTLRMNRCG